MISNTCSVFDINFGFYFIISIYNLIFICYLLPIFYDN